MAATKPPNMLAGLKFEKKNNFKKEPLLPKNARITTRPISHAPTASPFIGPSVPKIVYVSSSTPLMSAVKRVQKLLKHAEKRQMQRAKDRNKAKGKGGRDTKMSPDKIAAEMGEENGQEPREKVFVKASGRAMEKAVKVGNFFRDKGEEWPVDVEVKTGSVCVVDDVVLDDTSKGEDDEVKIQDADTTKGIGDEALDEVQVDSDEAPDGDNVPTDVRVEPTERGESSTSAQGDRPDPPEDTQGKKSGRKKKRKRKVLEEDEVPEQRIRWVKTVDVIITLR